MTENQPTGRRRSIMAQRVVETGDDNKVAETPKKPKRKRRRKRGSDGDTITTSQRSQ